MNNRAHSISKIIEIGPELNQLLFLETPDIWMDVELTMAQFKSLIFIINDDKATPGKLAKALSVTSANVTGIIERLVKQGLVIRKGNPEDRRVLFLEATPKGISLYGSLLEWRAKDMSGILERMNSEEVAHLAQGLTALLRAVRERRDAR
jgi:DNA-binding MarR family transcriptional regulator